MEFEKYHVLGICSDYRKADICKVINNMDENWRIVSKPGKVGMIVVMTT